MIYHNFNCLNNIFGLAVGLRVIEYRVIPENTKFQKQIFLYTACKAQVSVKNKNSRQIPIVFLKIDK